MYDCCDSLGKRMTSLLIAILGSLVLLRLSDLNLSYKNTCGVKDVSSSTDPEPTRASRPSK